ncbi:MAG: hypothetical protein U5R06_16800 [candidate division KSB1 bacterium]|nr:hypothetical protein [candidate division KSB1 bacterium]
MTCNPFGIKNNQGAEKNRCTDHGEKGGSEHLVFLFVRIAHNVKAKKRGIQTIGIDNGKNSKIGKDESGHTHIRFGENIGVQGHEQKYNSAGQNMPDPVHSGMFDQTQYGAKYGHTGFPEAKVNGLFD